jgi:hypothetical protein
MRNFSWKVEGSKFRPHHSWLCLSVSYLFFEIQALGNG